MCTSVYKIKYGVAHYLIVNNHLSQQKKKRKRKRNYVFVRGGGGRCQLPQFWDLEKELTTNDNIMGKWPIGSSMVHHMTWISTIDCQ